MLDKHSIKLNTNIDNDVTLNSYPGVFSQIINNLVMNSITHAFEETSTKEIWVNASVNAELETLTITYQDNGSGMDKNTQAKIFEPFFTTKRGKGGSGLGMHIVFNLVTHKLKGGIAIDSQLNQGTTITIQLPTGAV